MPGHKLILSLAGIIVYSGGDKNTQDQNPYLARRENINQNPSIGSFGNQTMSLSLFCTRLSAQQEIRDNVRVSPGCLGLSVQSCVGNEDNKQHIYGNYIKPKHFFFRLVSLNLSSVGVFSNEAICLNCIIVVSLWTEKTEGKKSYHCQDIAMVEK